MSLRRAFRVSRKPLPSMTVGYAAAASWVLFVACSGDTEPASVGAVPSPESETATSPTGAIVGTPEAEAPAIDPAGEGEEAAVPEMAAMTVPPAMPAEPAVPVNTTTPGAPVDSPILEEPAAPSQPGTPEELAQSPAPGDPEIPGEPEVPPEALATGVKPIETIRLLSYSLIGRGGYTHRSIPQGNDLLRGYEQKHGIEVTIYDGNQRDNVTEEFTGDNLLQYDAIVFNNPNARGLSDDQRVAFRRFIEAGHGYVGIHAAINCEKDWDWYHDLVGAFEVGVDGRSNSTLAVHVGPSTEHLGDMWSLRDEWHEHSRTVDDREGFNLLLTRQGRQVAWYRELGEARMWYTGLGHEAGTFALPEFEEHVWQGILWATGRREATAAE